MDVASLGIIPVLLLGACVGSFLNVVIYRLPIGLSISQPRWSFCPTCEKRIPPHCNIPILGWLFLGGRCRDCKSPISIIYPVVEAATALLFVLIWDAIVVAKVMPGGGSMPSDWPMVVAVLFLFAGLLAGSVMDLETYSIHIQIPVLTIVAAVICHAIRGLPTGGDQNATLLPPALCGIGLAMGVGWLVSLPFQKPAAQPNHDPPVPPDTSIRSDPAPVPIQPPWRFQPIPVLLLVTIVVGLSAWQALAPSVGFHMAIPPAGQRAIVGSGVLLLILILASLESRESDVRIVDDLERERPLARAMALRELASFLPALVAGAVALAWLRYGGHVGHTWKSLLTVKALQGEWSSHAAGGLHALAAAILAAAVGWAVRILGTLAFGKEAFGSGDIFIMASIGAVGGLWLVVVGFLVSSILALVGVLATSFKKTSRAIPFGPWLALGALVSLWGLVPLTTFFSPLGWFLWAVMSGQPGHGFGD